MLKLAVTNKERKAPSLLINIYLNGRYHRQMNQLLYLTKANRLTNE